MDIAPAEHHLLAQQRHATVDKALCGGQPFDIRSHRFGELRRNLLDARDDAQPDFVAQVFGRSVRRILAERNLLLQRIVQNLLARGEEQRPDQPPVGHTDSGQSAQPGAAQQVDEKSLHRIVAVVGNGDVRITVFVAEAVEPVVAQPPRSHLHRFPGTLHLPERIEADVVVRYTELFGTLRHQLFVLFGLGAPQLEIAVRYADPVTRLGEQRQHHHRIDTAADSQQDAIPVRADVMLGHIIFEFTQQSLHIELYYNNRPL